MSSSGWSVVMKAITGHVHGTMCRGQTSCVVPRYMANLDDVVLWPGGMVTRKESSSRIKLGQQHLIQAD